MKKASNFPALQLCASRDEGFQIEVRVRVRAGIAPPRGVDQHGMTMKIVPTVRVDWPPPYKDATEKYSSQDRRSRIGRNTLSTRTLVATSGSSGLIQPGTAVRRHSRRPCDDLPERHLRRILFSRIFIRSGQSTRTVGTISSSSRAHSVKHARRRQDPLHGRVFRSDEVARLTPASPGRPTATRPSTAPIGGSQCPQI